MEHTVEEMIKIHDNGGKIQCGKCGKDAEHRYKHILDSPNDAMEFFICYECGWQSKRKWWHFWDQKNKKLEKEEDIFEIEMEDGSIKRMVK